MAMTRGQDSLMMELDKPHKSNAGINPQSTQPLLIALANLAEITAHEEYLAALAKSGDCVWQSLSLSSEN
jgi:DNA polymerase-3 subunit epsilon